MWAYTASIYHHGIPGQKRGVRRYQNLDGTYTQLGLERRYGKHRRDSDRSSISEKDETIKNRRIDNKFKIGTAVAAGAAGAAGVYSLARNINKLAADKAKQIVGTKDKDSSKSENQNGVVDALKSTVDKAKAATGKDTKNQDSLKGIDDVLKSTKDLPEDLVKIRKTYDNVRNANKPKPNYSSISSDTMREELARYSLEKQYAAMKKEQVELGRATVDNKLVLMGQIASTGIKAAAAVLTLGVILKKLKK